MREHDALVGEYSHDISKVRAPDALLMLRKIASMVKPIMRQRGWRVGLLSEFYPAEQNLLGVNWNRGQKVCLRLRYPGDETQFMPIENVTDTMLHELCHNVHGPHNEAFHALWNQLRDEYEALVRKGYSGEGFLSAGRKLGGANVPMHEVRRRARAAAEQRRLRSSGSGRRLGGAPVRRSEDIRKVIADAAQHRLMIMKGCGSAPDNQSQGRSTEAIVEEASQNGFRTKAEEDSANQRAIMQAYMELVQEDERQRHGAGYVPPSERNPAGSQAASTPTSLPNVASDEQQAIEASRSKSDLDHKALTISPDKTTGRLSKEDANKPDTPKPPDPPLHGIWTCPICTCNNMPKHLCCDACGTERPSHTYHLPSSTTDSFTTLEKGRPPSLTRSANPRTTAQWRAQDAALARERAVATHTRLASYRDAEAKKPLGWLCGRCGTFMETQWWTCSGCGALKDRS